MFDDGQTTTIAPPKDQPKQQGMHDPAALANDPTVKQVQGPSAKDASGDERAKHRHLVLMDLLDYEAERQAEERMQMQIDEAGVKEMSEIQGFWVASETKAGGMISSRSDVVEISQKAAPAGIYDVPAGYAKKTAFTMEDMQRQ